MTGHAIERDERDGFEGVGLVSAELRAAFAVGVGMVGYSLEHEGEELLGQRGGLRRYAETGSSFGIPLLHPWANRLDGMSYEAAGRHVELEPDAVRLDPNGLPIHGLLTASPYWELVAAEAADDTARLEARIDLSAHEELFAAFPFPHELSVTVELAGPRLALTTTVTASGDTAVPISFGWHPYLTLPGVPRADWVVDLSPLARRAALDPSGLPTGETEPFDTGRGPLGGREFDDLFDRLRPPARFELAGGGRAVAVEFEEEAYSAAQVYAPADEDFICFEPMTAPTNALVSGDSLRLVQPGASFSAGFSITVEA